MLKKFAVSILSFACLTSVSYAKVSFSPYADLTINTHWDSDSSDMVPMDLDQISQSTGIKHYHLAFITDAGNCVPAWGAQASYSVDSGWGSHLTEKLKNQNIDYTISLGGASGNDLSLACSSTQLVSAYEKIISTYHPAGLDFDIENGTANVAKIMNALQIVQKNHSDLRLSFTLPVLPEGLVSSGEDIVRQAKQAGLDFAVNIMAMDYGSSYQESMGKYAIDAATNLYNFLKTLYPDKSNELWQKIQVTPMIGVNDVNTEHFTLQDAVTLRNFAEQKNLGGLSMWSIARDNPCLDQWPSPTCSGANLQTNSYDFASRFVANNP